MAYNCKVMKPNPKIPVQAWLRRLADSTQLFRLVNFEKRATDDHSADYVATLALKKSRSNLQILIDARARLNPREAIGLCAELQPRKQILPLVLACPAISNRVAEICRQHNVGYLDGVGNCDIRAPGLAIHVEGKPNSYPDTRSLSNPFSQKGGRVVRLLLSHPVRTWKVTEMAHQCKVSLSLVSKAKTVLINQGYVTEDNQNLMLRDPLKLLEAWSGAYKPSYQKAFLYSMDDELSALESAVVRWCKQHQVQYGLSEFSGAWRLAPMVRYKQASICMYDALTTNLLEQIQSDLGMKPVESGSNVVIMTASDESVFYDAREVEGFRVQSPLQLYLDLSSHKGRGKEAADELLRRLISPGFVQANDSKP